MKYRIAIPSTEARTDAASARPLRLPAVPDSGVHFPSFLKKGYRMNHDILPHNEFVAEAEKIQGRRS